MKKPPFTSLLGKLQRRHSALLARRNPSIPRGTMASTVDTPPRAHRQSRAAGVEVRPEPGDNPFCQERLGSMRPSTPGPSSGKAGAALCARRGLGSQELLCHAESRVQKRHRRIRFWDEPCVIPETDSPDTNVYDMRLVQHEDGWIYGLFCTERRDPRPRRRPIQRHRAVRHRAHARISRTGSAFRSRHPLGAAAQCCPAPEFVRGQYALYTRPQDSFIDAGSGGGIGGHSAVPSRNRARARRRSSTPACTTPSVK